MHGSKSKKHCGDEFLTGVAFGRTMAWLEAYAERTGINLAILTARMGTLILGCAGGEASGLPESLHVLHGTATEDGGDARRLSAANLDDASHGQARGRLKKTYKTHRHSTGTPRRKLSAAARRRIAKAQRERWARVKRKQRAAAPRSRLKTQARMRYRLRHSKNPTLRQQAERWFTRQGLPLPAAA